MGGPVRVVGDHGLAGADAVGAGVARGGRLGALADGGSRVEQHAAHRDDADVRDAEVLAGAVGYLAHALLDGEVLLAGALDAGEGEVLLLLAVDEVVVAHVADGPVAAGDGLGVDALPLAEVGDVPRGERLAGGAPREAPAGGGDVVDGDEGVHHLLLAAARRGGVERHPEEVEAPVVLRLVAGVPAADDEAEVGLQRLEPGRVLAGAVHLGHVAGVPARVLPVAETAVGVHRAVQVDGVDGVDAALDGLGVVVLLEVPGDVAVAVRHARPLELRHRLHLLLRAHVRPEDAAALPDGVGLQPDLVPEVAVGRLGRHVDAPAVDVELPAVVGAAEAVLLVAPEEEVGVAVGAEAVDEPDLPGAVPEGDEPLAEQLDADGHAVCFGDVLGQQEGYPVAAHQRAHLRSGADAGQPFVVQCAQHDDLPLNVQRFFDAARLGRRGAAVNSATPAVPSP